MRAFASLAAWPGVSPAVALLAIEHHAPSDPLFGRLGLDEVQLVPQMAGTLTCEGAADLVRTHPGTRFRLHANVRVLPEYRLADLSNFALERRWFDQAARVSKVLGARAYTAHAGRRVNASLQEAFDNCRRAADLFRCPVGIEGLYPSRSEDWLLSTWAEYRQLLTVGVPYALDLSHLQILATQSGQLDLGLVSELLASCYCMEIHVSHNDGRADSHHPCPASPPWWFDLLQRALRYPEHSNGAVVFSEGNLRHHKLARATHTSSTTSPSVEST